MKLKAIKNTKKRLNIAEKELGIKKPGDMSITDLLGTMHRYGVRRNSYRLRREFSKYVKKQNVIESDLSEATRLNNNSLSDLKKLAKLQRIMN